MWTMIEHPLAEAIVSKAKQSNVKLHNVTTFKAIPGKGVEAIVQRKKYYIGKPTGHIKMETILNHQPIIAMEMIPGTTLLIYALDNG